MDNRRARRAIAIIRAHPEWGRDRINREIRRRSGHGLRAQTLSDLIHVVRGSEPRRRAARDRIGVLRMMISSIERRPRLRVPSSMPRSPRLDSDDPRVTKYARDPRRMIRPDLPHDVYVDVQTMRPVTSRKRRQMQPDYRTEYVTLRLGAMTRDNLVRAWKSGQLMSTIRAELRDTIETPIPMSEVSILGFWVSRYPRAA